MAMLERILLKQSIAEVGCYWRYLDDAFCVTEVDFNVETIPEMFDGAHSAISFTIKQGMELISLSNRVPEGLRWFSLTVCLSHADVGRTIYSFNPPRY